MPAVGYEAVMYTNVRLPYFSAVDHGLNSRVPSEQTMISLGGAIVD